MSARTVTAPLWPKRRTKARLRKRSRARLTRTAPSKSEGAHNG